MKLFGTDGIRTRAGEFPLNAATIVAIGQAIGEELGGPVLVGQDTRISSPWILHLLFQGIARSAGKAEAAGVIPTPAVALLTRSHSFSGGIMISASHNPYEDNGIKVFSHDGTKLKDDVEQKIEKRILELLPANAKTTIDRVPDSHNSSDTTSWVGRYEQLLLSHFPKGEWLKGIRIVVDCANGAMSVVAPAVLKSLGAERPLDLRESHGNEHQCELRRSTSRNSGGGDEGRRVRSRSRIRWGWRSLSLCYG